jgi:hypothetical protein
MAMTPFSLTDLAKIIERDSKDSTYKFALLRGTIDIIQNFPHYRETDGKTISYPMGLMVLKWIEYYYPLLASEEFIPQKYGDDGQRTIAFRREFTEVIALYRRATSYHELYHDLKRGMKDKERLAAVLKLVRKLRDTIVKQPMHYIGSAIGMGGMLYYYNGNRARNPESLDLNWIIEQMGSFFIPIDFHTVLRDVGTFVAGTNSIIFKWADFTSNIVPGSEIKTGNIITMLSDLDVERDVLQAKHFYRNIIEQDQVECIWSGRKLNANMHIDHLLPFSALHNNDLWNLLPSSDAVNIKKKDAIPTKAILSERKIRDRIIGYWEQLHATFEGQFIRELNISLLGHRLTETGNWQSQGYNGLIDMSEHLIHNRGLTPWNYKIH